MKSLYLLIISLFLISCSSTGIYKVTVTQGTVLKQEDLDKLEIGMNRDQVIFLLGNPTFENFFEPNVWNYFYQVSRGVETLYESKVKIIFDDNDNLKEIRVIKLEES